MSCQKNAVFLTAVLAILSISSILYVLWPHEESAGYTADIYQEGTLIMSIPLDKVEEIQTFTIKGAGGCTNQVEVRPGGIAIIAADCPDKLCVKQGFLHDSRLPITCLPNRIVIQLRPAPAKDSPEPDMITY